MQHFKLCIITSANKCSIEEWEDMEAIMMQTLKTTQDYGGINIISERKHDQKQFQCKLCEFRSNHKSAISQHKRREHTDYMLLCDQCGYTTNDLGNLKGHFRRKHP